MEECNRKYPTGLAAAFRALKPDYSGHRGPPELDGEKMPEARRLGLEDRGISLMLSDEWEAARAFRYWVNDYLEGRCRPYAKTDAIANPKASMLARLLAFVKYKDASKAPWAWDESKPGNFPFYPKRPGETDASLVNPVSGGRHAPRSHGSGRTTTNDLPSVGACACTVVCESSNHE